MALTRRRVLSFGIFGGAVISLSGVGLGLLPGVTVPAPQELLVLGPREYSIVSALASCHCDAPGLPSAASLDIAGLVDAHLSTLAKADQEELLLGLRLLENALAGLLLSGRPRTFTGSSRSVQRATLEAWRTSSFLVQRKVWKATRALVVASYWGHPDLYARAGYPGPPDFSAWTPPPKPSAGEDSGATPSSAEAP